MAAIYANSYFTIAACEGTNGDAGLPGTSAHRPRNDPFHRLQFSPAARFIGPSEIAIGLGAPYFYRGWTYQEWTLSRRILVFHDQTATWKCRRMLKNEAEVTVIEFQSIERLERPFMPHEDNAYLFSPWPDIHAYARAVKSYSTRMLTFEGDFLLAFSSIMNVMGRSMQGGILYGLPEMCFDGALLWDVDLPCKPLTRRKYSPRKPLSRRRDSAGNVIERLPSWSFSGWNCGISTKTWRMVYYYDLSGENGACTKNDDHLASLSEWVHLTSIVAFYKVNEATNVREKIVNRFYVEDNDTAKGKDVFFEHLPHTFKFHTCESPPPPGRIDVYSPVIEFRTERLFARISAWEGDVKHVITDDAGCTIGRISIPEHESPIPRAEFIRLSLARSPSEEFWQHTQQAEQVHLKCPKADRGPGFCIWDKCIMRSGWTHSFYFVLWIEWNAGIAYRKALGWIDKSYWDAAETDTIDVRLG